MTCCTYAITLLETDRGGARADGAGRFVSVGPVVRGDGTGLDGDRRGGRSCAADAARAPPQAARKNEQGEAENGLH